MTNYIACLKHGTKYSPEYVNVIYNMVRRHCTIDYKFICFTENPKGLDPEITVMPLPDLGIHGDRKSWWYKTKMFDPSNGLGEGTLLFFDLDIVITQNIDKLFSFQPGKFCIIQDFNRVRIPNYHIKNSSVFRLQLGTHERVWTKFLANPKKIMGRLHGDQDWITEQIPEATLWPHDWIMSYKWEIGAHDQQYAKQYGMTKYERSIKTTKTTIKNGEKQIVETWTKHTIPQDLCILVFHGPPKPHETIRGVAQPDPLVLEHWK